MTTTDVLAAGIRAGQALVAAATLPDGSVDLLRLTVMMALFDEVIHAADPLTVYQDDSRAGSGDTP